MTERVLEECIKEAQKEIERLKNRIKLLELKIKEIERLKNRIKLLELKIKEAKA